MFTDGVRCVKLAKMSAVALVVSEDAAIEAGSHCALTCETCDKVAETVGRFKKAPAPAVPSPSKTERPRRSSGENDAERVSPMSLNWDWKGRAVIVAPEKPETDELVMFAMSMIMVDCGMVRSKP